MSSAIHIAEIAALLAVAYVAGWAVGYVLHRLVARPAASTGAAIPAERLAAVTGEPADALVKAPTIVPVANDPPPAAPVTPVEPVPVAEPPPVAEVPTPVEAVAPVLPPVSIPEIPLPTDLVIDAPAAPAEPAPVAVEPTPVVPEPVAAATLEQESTPSTPTFTATPALRPGEAWSGEIRGRAAEPFAPPAPEPVAPVAQPEPPAAAPVTPAPQPVPEDDEDAAMRAIEGGWSRIRARALPNAPELHDVGVAVASATAAVEQVLAQASVGVAPELGGKPLGLVRPRNGGKDDLKRITGIGGLDETTLNNLGVFHFDQIAAWSEAEVLWMESHVFARGRIGHENWQAQARQLAAAVEG